MNSARAVRYALTLSLSIAGISACARPDSPSETGNDYQNRMLRSLRSSNRLPRQ